MDTCCPQIFSFFAFLFLLTQQVLSNGLIANTRDKEPTLRRGIIGAFIDCGSRIGKEQKVAMEMAIMDFNHKMNQSFALHQIQVSQGEPFFATLAAKELVDKKKVEAIIAPQRWEEASLVADIANQAKIPIISLDESTPKWATERWPFMVQASPNQHLQMRAFTSIVQAWEWHQVTIIYQDDEYSSMAGDIPFLLDSLREESIEIIRVVPLSTSSLIEELEKMKQDQCRVFLVHLSFPLAIRLFEKAKEMEMIEKDYVWVATNAFTSLIHSINISTFSSMLGILGLRSYFPQKKPHFRYFDRRFPFKLASEFEEEYIYKHGVHALQAYDAMWTICLAMKESKELGQHLLNKILESDFQGLSGKIKFINQKLAPSDTFQVINVVGRSYTEIGFWSQRLGFSKTIDHEGIEYNSSMNSLGHILWPGDPKNIPRGWAIPTEAKRLQIGVPSMSSFKKYVNVIHNPLSNDYSYDGLAIDLFKATLGKMPYSLPHNFSCFNGTYDNLVEQIHLKKFDAVVGDVAIVATRYQYAEFTHPYTESGLVMIVPVKRQTSKREWLFMKPFTKAMWGLAVAINLYNGFVVWLIERNYCPELRGSSLNQIGTLLSLAFTTLFSLQGEKLHSNLSRMAMVVWLFVALVITQTYTANLTSILTVTRLEPKVADVQSLQISNSKVGYCRGSFVSRYLINVLHFRQENVNNYNSPEEYAQALRSGEIAAAFLEAPFAKLFLAKYCKEFMVAGPTYKVGGFGFVFPRGSPLLQDVTKALLNVTESGKLRELENAMLNSEKCVNVEPEDEISSLSPSSFWVLFILTGGTSTFALVFYIAQLGFYYKMKINNSQQRSFILKFMLAVMKRKKQFFRRDSDIEMSPPNSVGV